MPNTVLAQLVRRNSTDYECVHTESILCGEAVTEGFYWRIPVIHNGVHTGFTFRKSESKPTADSVKTIRVNDKKHNVIYYVAVADNASENLFNEACNECCDGTASLALVTLPAIIIEEAGCADANGNYNYFTIAPTSIAGTERYILSGSANGTPLAAAPAIGFTSLAALATWADANWNTGGLSGVTVDGGKVTLNGDDTILTGSIHIAVVRYFESNTPGALTAGQNYVLNATVNGNVLPTLEGADDAALATVATLANNTAAYAAYGTWAESSGKIVLLSNAISATIAVTKV